MISNLAIVETKEIDSNVSIGEFSIVRDLVEIGHNTTIHPHVTINSRVVIGNNVVIHPNVVISSDVVIGNDVEIFPGTVIGKIPKGAGATARSIDYISKVLVGDECALGPNAVIFYDVEIGNNTLIGDGASLREQVRVGHHCIISRYVTINYNTSIGNNTRIMDLTHITGNGRIGDNVFISVLVSTTNDNVVTNRVYSEETIKGPIIEHGATVGASASLLPNVIIGENAFVAAGSVVTKNVEPNSMVMGIPARFVRKLENKR